jgi:hypothetical protein
MLFLALGGCSPQSTGVDAATRDVAAVDVSRASDVFDATAPDSARNADAGPLCDPAPPIDGSGAGLLGLPLPAAPITAQVAAVDPSGMDLALPDAGSVRFAWIGPQLPFQPGDAVTVVPRDAGNGWDVVEGERGRAAALSEGLAGPLAPIRPLDAAPTLTLAAECCVALPFEFPSCPLPCAPVFALDASWGRTSVHVGPTQSGAVGTWSVTNVGIIATVHCDTDQAHSDWFGHVLVTMLGPPRSTDAGAGDAASDSAADASTPLDP